VGRHFPFKRMRALTNLETKSAFLGHYGPQRTTRESLSAGPTETSAIQNSPFTPEACKVAATPSAPSSCIHKVPQKDANQWVSHLALARSPSNNGDFPPDTKENDSRHQRRPRPTKPFLQPLLKRLEAKDDINTSRSCLRLFRGERCCRARPCPQLPLFQRLVAATFRSAI